MKRDLPEKFDAATHFDLMRWIGWIVAVASSVLAAVFGLYFLQFSNGTLSADLATWGQFGDFVGGTANPILAFLTLNALVLTIVLQSKQLSISSRELELSRRELELTREELSRSAHAQELSEKALRAQAATAEKSARLSAINFLLDHYKNELRDMRGVAYTANDPRLVRMQLLQRREHQLLAMLDEIFRETSGEGEADGTNPVQDR
ncbi:hypothetical protein [Zoogloea sp.]|uniref:hypothetical protein n=1 Tax=Zoogloea sp. TaxID=49181 RepID=UPI001D35476C|nr:hypothetical protein [Zoogloea sp.]MBK6653815.1 hypothetical protein [Zoogloea sp.]